MLFRLALLAAVVWPLPALAQPSAPDVLLLLVDGLGFEKTPSVASLAERSLTFERVYLPHPLAGPSRAALFLGWRPEGMRIWGEPERQPGDTILLPARFAKAGYETVRVGRAAGAALDASFSWTRVLQPSPEADTARHLVTEIEASRRAPLFLVAGFDDLGPVPSVPADAARSGAGLEYPAILLGDLPEMGRPAGRGRAPRAREEARTAVRRAYGERSRRLNAQLARVWAALERRQLWTRTIVVLAGTQAPDFGEHGVFARSDTLFESRLRVPLLLAPPGAGSAGAGRSSSGVASLIDLYPTLVEVAGLPAVSETHGKSLAGILRDPSASARSFAASVVQRQPGKIGRTARTDRWRYTEWPDGSRELYDHESDPREYTNLAGRKEYRMTAEKLKARVIRRGVSTRTAKSATNAAERSKRPNVLMILLDDANVHLGTYGFPVKTPHVDRLARLGRRFDRAYAQVPSCSPSRTSLLSGWAPERTAIWDNVASPRRPGMRPLEELFAAQGYFTAQIGKVWETRFSKLFKWDVSEYDPIVPLPPGESASPRTEEPPAKRPAGLQSMWRKTDNRDEEEPDGHRARRVVQLLEQPRDRPFFIALGFAKPHLKWVSPRRYFDLYDPKAIVLPPNPLRDVEDVPEIAIEELSRPGRFLVPGDDDVSAEERRQATAAYYAVVSFVDAQVGVVLGALDRLRLWDDTIVVLLSDNGFHLSEHAAGFWRKDTLFEESLRVPLIFAGFGVRAPGAPSRGMVELVDIYPTLVDLAGVPSPSGLDGVSLRPILRDPQARVRTHALSARRVIPSDVAASVRSGRWRYTLWPDGVEELHDLEKDPQQLDNLAERAEHAAQKAQLRGYALADP